MTMSEKDAIVSGVGISEIGRNLPISGLELTGQAARQAIADAGLTPSDIDGLATLGDTSPKEVAGALGLTPAYRGGGFDTGGLLSPVMSAAIAVSSGQARHVLVYRTVQMMGGTVGTPADRESTARSSRRASNTGKRQPKPAIGPMAGIEYLLAANAYSAANWLGMHAVRHMHDYGTTKEQLGWLALNSRNYASKNPKAIFRDQLTMDDYLTARAVSTPFGLYDCDVPVAGSIAVIVSAADYAADAPGPRPRVEAIGGSTGAGGWTQREDFPKMASADAAAQMWSRTSLRPSDLDIAELYDGFTFLTIAWLEALGICGDGEGGPFVEGATAIAIDGALPLNTYGGQLSAGRMHGYWVLHEACLQLRGEAIGNQVLTRPEVAVVSAGGGPIAGCMLLTC